LISFSASGPGSWAATTLLGQVIYQHVLRRAEDQGKNGEFGYSPKVIDDLISYLRELVHLAKDGSAVMGLDKAVDILEKIRDFEPRDALIEMSCGYREGDKEFEEGEIVGLAMSDEGVELSYTQTTYSREVGSDHSSEHFDFDCSGLEQWHEKLTEVLRHESVNLRISYEGSRP
jgi:hypothetical protein